MVPKDSTAQTLGDIKGKKIGIAGGPVDKSWLILRAYAKQQYGIDLCHTPELGIYDGVVLAVAHEDFRALGADLRESFGKKTCVVYDLKHMLPEGASDLRL